MKRLRIAVLAIILLFQTILYPFASFADAVSFDSEQSLLYTNDEVSSEVAISSEHGQGQSEEQPSEGPVSQEGQQDSAQASEDIQQENATQNEAKSEGEIEKPNKTLFSLFSTDSIKSELDRNDSNLSFTEKLSINNEEVPQGSNPTVDAKVGDTVKYDVKIEFKTGHEYGGGSKYEYELPALFVDLKLSATDIYYSSNKIAIVSKSGQKITIEFTDEIRDEVGQGTVAEVYFTVQATLEYGESDWSQEISVPGYEKITVNFKPNTSKGSTITKNGKADNNGQNSQYIEWIVDVNTNLGINSNSGTTTFKDVLTGAHTFEAGAVQSIHELKISPNGSVTVEDEVTGITPTISSDQKELAIELPNKEHTGYRIVYKTKVGDPGNVESAEFKNNATYNGGSASKNVRVNFGTPLEKTHNGPNVNDLTTEWIIKYNHNKRTISKDNAKLKDTWTTGHILVGEIKVYGEDGTTEIAPSLYTITKNNNGFELVFNQDVTDAYVIKYKTKPDGIYPSSSDLKITNKVTREDMKDKPASDSVTYTTTNFVLKKDAVGVDYQNKTMSWKITANQGKYALQSGTRFVDTYNEPNMTVIGTPTVTVGGKDFTNFTFDRTTNGEDKETGFIITLNESVSEEIVITYQTEYDIKDVGQNNRTFKNTVTLKDTGILNFNEATKEATQSIKTEQRENGSKTGEYNYEKKEFTWTVLLNFNYNTIPNAIFKDTLPESQTVTSMKVEKGEMNASGKFVPSSDSNDTKEINVTGFGNEIVYELGDISTPYRITYTSVDADRVYPHNGTKIKIKNNAKLYEEGNENNPNADWSKEITIEHTDKILVKDMTQEGTSSKINWNIKFNYAQSELKNIVITDEVGKVDGSPGQLILKDSFKVWEMNFTDTNPNPVKGNQVALNDENLIVDVANGTFTLKFPDGDKAYYLEYSTIYMGPSPGELENTAIVTYESTDGNAGSDKYLKPNFTYSGGGNVKTVPFVVLKTDAATGKPMENVKFDLYGPYTGNAVILSGTTNEDGVLDFNFNFALSTNQNAKYKLVEEKQDGYKALTYEFVLDAAKVQTSGKYAGKVVIELANEPEDAPGCPKFELTLKDVDGKPFDNGEKVTLKNKNSGIEMEYTIGNDGKVIFKRNADISGSESVLTAGEYEVIYNGEKIDEITVQYDGECKDTVQMIPSCPKFTIELLDENGNPRQNVEVALKDKAGNEIATATTDSEGKITVPSTTPAGQYELYEGKQYLQDVTISYNNGCETTVVQAPKCPAFTLTSVYDVNGHKLGEGVEITLKQNGAEVAKATIDADGKVTFANLPSGKYEVYKGDKKLGEVSTNTDCETAMKPIFIPGPSCPNFTIKLLDENGNPRQNVEVALKDKAGNEIATATTDSEGKITVPSTTPAGQYELYEGKQYLQDVTISYNNGCETTVVQAPKCPNFTLTITNDLNGNPIKEGTTITLKNKETGEEVSGSIEKNGKLSFTDLAKGVYEVYLGKVKLGEIETNASCETVLKPVPSCPAFKITLKDDNGSPRSNVKVTVKDSKGNVIVVDAVTNKDGSISIKTGSLPAGEYALYENNIYIGTITINYHESCNAELTYNPAPATDNNDGTSPGDSNHSDQDVKGGSDQNSKDKPELDPKQGKLPQTNGETKVVPVAIGFLLVVIASLLLVRRRKVDVE